jgi:lipase chaperone LimK
MGVAKAMQAINQPQADNPTPEQIAMEQVKVEGQKVVAKMAEVKAKTQTEAFKAQLDHQDKKADRDVRLEIAQIQERGRRAQRAEAAAQKFSQRRSF